ncbi:hypothetical protein [Arthrobacter sp. PM3]|uniref:hypothetical protein n=1 Tax=Arthrobacter sp. PM3 TaxID=2017685 RepID=UPI000E106B34|nr:hypothetical protein [Arthrobacter sp. PM3]AXJ09770.1 hypothetical protein CFN17_09160 [Arthrobacter sp. PM3]
MTGTREPQQDGSIQAMLSDSGLDAAAELRSSLEQLRALVPETAPAPRADLAALLAAGTAAPAATEPVATVPAATVTAATALLPTVPSANVAAPQSAADDGPPAGVVTLASRNRSRSRNKSRNRRLAIVGGAVIGAMSLGAGAVAASSEDFRHSVGRTVGSIFQPPAQPAPATEHVQPSPASIPTLPVPGATSTAAAPGATPTGAPTPGSSMRTPGSAAPGHTAPAVPPAVGRDGILPTPGQRPVTPGIPAVPGMPDHGDRKDLPHGPGDATPTLPGTLPTKLPDEP